jgi:hypothetical protein
LNATRYQVGFKRYLLTAPPAPPALRIDGIAFGLAVSQKRSKGTGCQSGFKCSIAYQASTELQSPEKMKDAQ